MPASQAKERRAAVLEKVMRACRSSSTSASDSCSNSWRSDSLRAQESPVLMATCRSVECGRRGERAQLGAVDLDDAHHQRVGGLAEVEQRLALHRLHELEVRLVRTGAVDPPL